MDSSSSSQIPLRTRRALWAFAALLTLVLGVGLLWLRVETGIIDWLPRHHPNVASFQRLFEELPGAVNQELIWLELDPEKAGALGVKSIEDHRSFLAQQELLEYLEERVPEIRGSFGILSLLRVARGMLPGTEPGETGLPTGALETRLVWGALKLAAGDMVRALLSSDAETPGTVLTLLVDAAPLSARGREIATNLETALAAYRNDPELEHDLFEESYLYAAGLASGTAAMDRSLRQDILRITPIAFVVVVVALRLALGSWRALGIVFALTVVGCIWTLGFMGWFGTSLNIVTFALIPLIMGCGIDYAILVSLDTLDRRGEGKSMDATLAAVRETSGKAILLATLTTTGGLLSLVFSDSLGIAGLGLHGALGMLSLAFLSVLVLPELIVRFSPGRASRFGPIVAPVAVSFAKNRNVVLIVAAIATIAAAVMARKPIFLLDVIEGNYPPESPIARTVERIQEKCGGAFPEIIIARGPLEQPAAMQKLVEVEGAVEQSARLGESFRVVGVPDILAIYRVLEERALPGGGLNLPRGTAALRASLPPEEGALRQTAAAIHEDPDWSGLAAMFFDPELTIGTILLLAGDAGRDMESVQTVWTELQGILRSRGAGEPALELSFLGYRTMAYLFAEYSERWIYVTMAVSVTIVLLLTAVFLRDARAVRVMFIVMVISGIWWLALMELAGINVSIFLLFPLIFAVCIGSDYGLHMLCRIQAERAAAGEEAATGPPGRWARRVWSTTGRAIAVAALTDGLIFLLYTRMELVSASQVMRSLVLAVVAVFGCTIFLIPALAIPRPSPDDTD